MIAAWIRSVSWNSSTKTCWNLRLDRRPDGFVPTDQFVGNDKKVVEIQHRGFLLALGVSGDDLVERGGERVHQSVCDLAEQLAVGPLHVREVRFGLAVEHLAATCAVLPHPGGLAKVGPELEAPFLHRIDPGRLPESPKLPKSWLGLEAIEEECRQGSKVFEQCCRPIFFGIRSEPADEGIDRFDQVDIESALEVGPSGAGLRMIPLQIGEVLDEFDDFERIVLGEYDDRIVRADLTRETVNQPRPKDGLEHRVGAGPIHHTRSRIQRGLDCVASNDLLAEAVNGRRADLVEVFGG